MLCGWSAGSFANAGPARCALENITRYNSAWNTLVNLATLVVWLTA